MSCFSGFDQIVDIAAESCDLVHSPRHRVNFSLMAFDVVVLLFPIVLAIHNFDEYAQYEDFVNAYHPRLPAKLTTRPAVFWAATALTVVAAVICVSAFAWQSPGLLLVAKVSICALLLNAVSHCVLSLRRRKLLPGTRSACILVLPYGVMALVIMRTYVGDSAAAIIRYALLGAITIPLAVAVFLLVGNGIAMLRAPVGLR